MWPVCLASKQSHKVVYIVFFSLFHFPRHLRYEVVDLDFGVESSSILVFWWKALGGPSAVYLELLCDDHGSLSAAAGGKGGLLW